VSVRPATEDDRAWLRALLERPDVVRSLAITAADETDAALSRALDGADDVGVPVLDAGDGPVAVLRWSLRNRRSRIAVVQGLAVHPDARRRGHGVALVAAVTRELHGPRDVHRIEAEAFSHNAASLATFARCGYVREGVRRQAYDRDGAWQDTVLMASLGPQLPRSTPPH
jgi:RimJ/RimL family protein N-acetyltransferase